MQIHGNLGSFDGNMDHTLEPKDWMTAEENASDENDKSRVDTIGNNVNNADNVQKQMTGEGD